MPLKPIAECGECPFRGIYVGDSECYIFEDSQILDIDQNGNYQCTNEDARDQIRQRVLDKEKGEGNG